MKKALLAYGYGLNNAGDMAITVGAIQLLNNKYDVTVLSRYDETHKDFSKNKTYLKELFPHISIIPSPFKLDRGANVFKVLKDHAEGVAYLTGLKKAAELENYVKESDLVVFNGGNMFRCETTTDYARLSALMFPLEMARKNKVPYKILPQSASIINKAGQKKLNKTLINADIVWTRENRSFEYLDKLFSEINLKKSIDMAFFIDSNEKLDDKFDSKANEKTIAITVRTQTVGDLKKLDKQRSDYIESVLIKTISDLDNSNILKFKLIIQTEKDENVTKKIYDKIKSKINVEIVKEFDPIKLISIYKQCDLLIGMRLHSIILALSAGTPSVGFFEKEWGLKNPGLMNRFDLKFKLCDDMKLSTLYDDVAFTLNNSQKIKNNIQKIINEERNEIEKYI